MLLGFIAQILLKPLIINSVINIIQGTVTITYDHEIF